MIGDGMTDYEACPPGVRTCIHYCVSSLNNYNYYRMLLLDLVEM